MRLSETERQAIVETIRQADAEADIYLHGSRVDDNARGGDIDLLVLSAKIDLHDKLEILAGLHRRLGERRIDLAVYPDVSRPFPRVAMESGVLL